MMPTLAAVFRKELLETLRDRRALLSSLVMGPLFAPLLFIGMLAISLDRSVSALDEAVAVTVSGAERAPNLVRRGLIPLLRLRRRCILHCSG